MQSLTSLNSLHNNKKCVLGLHNFVCHLTACILSILFKSVKYSFILFLIFIVAEIEHHLNWKCSPDLDVVNNCANQPCYGSYAKNAYFYAGRAPSGHHTVRETLRFQIKDESPLTKDESLANSRLTWFKGDKLTEDGKKYFYCEATLSEEDGTPFYDNVTGLYENELNIRMPSTRGETHDIDTTVPYALLCLCSDIRNSEC